MIHVYFAHFVEPFYTHEMWMWFHVGELLVRAGFPRALVGACLAAPPAGRRSADQARSCQLAARASLATNKTYSAGPTPDDMTKD